MTSNLLIGKEFLLRLMNSILWEFQRKNCLVLSLFQIPFNPTEKEKKTAILHYFFYQKKVANNIECGEFLFVFLPVGLAFTVYIHIQLHLLLKLHDLIAISEVSK